VPNFKVAIVGAGPAGYFRGTALQNLANDDRVFEIDMIERLPTPWGLVRSGVAPDHPKIKTVSKVFEKIAAQETFRLFANVEVGDDITVAQLKKSMTRSSLQQDLHSGKSLEYQVKTCVDPYLLQSLCLGTTRTPILLA